MTITLKQFAAQCDKMAAELHADRVPVKVVTLAALQLKNAALVQLRKSVPSARLRNMRNARLTARFDVKTSGAARAFALVQANGPWQIIESDTRPHVILPKKIGRITGRGSKRANREAVFNRVFGGSGAHYPGAKPLRTPYGPRYRVQHPGTKGRHPWRTAVEATSAVAPKAMSASVVETFARVFR
ncbi:MAG TPA: hypothetical protein VN738_11310 [Acidothermaceae bacterium]|nr:hypothetical protein [Acidothermaceae bacterium]